MPLSAAFESNKSVCCIIQWFLSQFLEFHGCDTSEWDLTRNVFPGRLTCCEKQHAFETE